MFTKFFDTFGITIEQIMYGAYHTLNTVFPPQEIEGAFKNYFKYESRVQTRLSQA